MVAESASVEETVKKIVSRVTRKKDVTLASNTTFKDIGADSLDVVQILVALEDHYDIELVDDDLKSITSLGGFLDYVKKMVAERGSK